MRNSYESLTNLTVCARQAGPPTKSATFCARHAPRHAAGCTIADAIVRFSGPCPVSFTPILTHFSFEAGFTRETPGFSHSPRRTYAGLFVCTRAKRKIAYFALWLEPHTSHVHGPVHFAIEARVSASRIPSSTSHC